MSSDHFSVDGTVLEAGRRTRASSRRTPRDPTVTDRRAATPRSSGTARSGRTTPMNRPRTPRRGSIASRTTPPRRWPATRTTTPNSSSPTCARPVHAPRRTEQHEPPLRDRRARHPPRRLRHQPTDPNTGRGTLRLGQNSRSRAQAPLHRQQPQPSLVQDDHRRLQPHPDHRTRRSHRLMTSSARPPPEPPVGSRRDHQESTSPDRLTKTAILARTRKRADAHPSFIA